MVQVLSRFALDVNGKSGRGTQYRLQNRNVVPFTVDIQVKNTDIITLGIFQHFLLQAVKKLCVEEGWSETDLNNLTRLCDHIDSHGLTGATKMQVYRIRAC